MTDRLPSGETPSPSRGPKLSASSSSRNDCDESQWLLLPNNLEINSQSKPSKKQRNKEKLRSFPQENLSMSANVAEGFANECASHQNYPRAKCNTASWLKDQLVESKLHDQKPKKKVHGAEEMFPDSDMAIRCSGLNFPILTNDVPEQPEEAQRPSSRRSLTDNENTKSRKDECRKNEADSAIVMERLSQIQDFLTDATTFCQELEFSDEPVSEKSGYAVNDISPSSSSKASNAKTNVHRDTNSSSGFCNDDHVNKCKNMIEELQQFAGTPMSSKLQETLLYYMQKKSENKLTSMQGSSNLGPQDTHDLEAKRSAQEAMLSCNEELHNISSNSTWIVANEEQHRWGAKNSAQNPSFDQSEKQLSNWKEDTKDVKQLQTHMKKRVQPIQHIPDMKNVSRSISSDDCDVSNVGEQVAAVEFERKKLKNKLVELQEKKKLNDVMLQKLCYLKDATQTVANSGPKREERPQYPSSSRNSQPQAKNKRRADTSLTHADKKLIELQGVLQKLEEGMIKSIFSDDFVQDGASANEASGTSGSRIDNRNIRSGSNVKRDNVKKEMNSGFPARRHYEAEGRANEDADVPNVPISSQPSVSNKWQRRPGKQGRIRNLQDRQVKLEKHVKLIDEILNSVHEAKNSGTPIPVEHLRLLSFLEREHTQVSDKELSSSSSEEECFETMTIENSMENPGTNTKEVFPEASRASVHQSDSKSSAACDGFVAMKDVMSFVQDSEKCGKSNPSETQQFLDTFFKDPNQDSDSNEGSDSDFPIAPDENMVTHPKLPAALHLNENNDHHENPPVVSRMENGGANSYQSLIHQLMQVYHNNSERRNEDVVRSSGEGDYIPNRNHACSLPSASEHVQSVSPLQFCRHQENLLLTQQNIATMESQNQGRNLRAKDKSAKKDNINNLSGKMGKLKIQNAVHASFAPMSGGSRDNVDSASMLSSELNLSHSGEGERKTILDILKRSKKKQKVYDRNHDNQICSNSSIESEPLESSNSALAANTSAATWGGSSTQENFGDENDVISSIIPEGNAVGGSNYHDTPKARKILKLGSLRGATSGSSSEQPISLPPSKDSTKDYQQHTSSHFIQQLKKQIDQLNALCQRELQSETPQASTNFFLNSNQNWLSACPPPQALPDIVHPYNQQLLLCLSQCYHTLYMQQLEIQHLHRCLRHNADAETLHVNNLSSQSENTEDIPLRPWCIPNSNPTMPSNMYSSEHLSSRSAYIPVSGTRPVRAVIHPANQETRVSQETLNNQVPPRTRANNFWDNFRSYSRQNLLSTSNTVKRNDNVSFPVAPQIRQVHPMVSNESIVSDQEMGNSYPSMSSDYMSFRSSLNADRSLQNPDGTLHNPDRAVQNSDIHDLTHRTKKTNSSSPLLVRSRGSEYHKKGSSSNNFSIDRNTRSARFHSLSNEFSVSSVPNETSINLIELHPNQEESKVENFSHICPSSTSEAAASSSIPESLNHTEGEHQSEFLLGLYSEVKALKSDVQRQEALNVIRSIALREKEGDSDSGQSKIKVDNTSCSKPETSITVASDQEVNNLSVETCSSTADEVDSEKIPNRLSSESSLPWMNQNLPTAAIPPLSKLTPSKSTSTGAVRKKTKLQSTCFWDSLSNSQACSVITQDSRTTVGDDYVASPLQPIRENLDFPAGVVDSIIVDLQFALPFGQMREDSSVSFWSSINAYIMSRIRAYMPVPLPHKSLASLRQTLDHVLTRFSGMKFCDCEAEFLKYISQLLYESLTCFMSTGRFTSSLPFMPDCEGASVQESEKPQDLCVKLPSETDDKTRELSINMPIDDVFLPPFQPVMQQNVLTTSGIDDNANIDSTQPFSIPTEEDILHEWGPEAEAEPEVEAGTEADLAEADQSPGQQGNISSTSHGMDAWSADQVVNLHNGPLSSDEITAASDDASEVTGAHCCPDSCGDEEVNLDNVPTKLCAEDEPQRLGEVVQLPSDDGQENNETSIENSENEVTSTK